MTHLQQFQAIADAQTIITRARASAAGVSDAVWQKLKRVGIYLDAAASAVAVDVMSDEPTECTACGWLHEPTDPHPVPYRRGYAE